MALGKSEWKSLRNFRIGVGSSIFIEMEIITNQLVFIRFCLVLKSINIYTINIYRSCGKILYLEKYNISSLCKCGRQRKKMVKYIYLNEKVVKCISSPSL